MYRIGLDLGGTKIHTVLLDEELHILGEDRRLTEAAEGPAHVIGRMLDSVHAVAEQAGVDIGRVGVVGVGSPGPLNVRTGVVLSPPNLPGWRNIPLREHMQSALGVPVHVDNDANAAGYAEWKMGAGRDTTDMLYLTVSTGIGGGAIVDGRIQWGEIGAAGEFGHVTIDPHGPLCNCGNRGCLEAMASGTAIAKSAAGQQLALGLPADTPITTEVVFQCFEAGNTTATELVEQALAALAIGITNFIHLYNPECVVIGGGVSEVGEVLFQPLRRLVSQRVFPHLAPSVRILRAELKGRAGAVGAALIADAALQ